jgi:hypothetical protein
MAYKVSVTLGTIEMMRRGAGEICLDFGGEHDARNKSKIIWSVAMGWCWSRESMC